MTLPISSEFVSKALSSVDLKATDYRGRTALHRAVSAQSNGAAVALLQAGASPHARDKDGRTSLHIAALTKNLFLTKVLLDAGADIDATDTSGNSALYLASLHLYSKFNDPVLKFLCLRGADIDMKPHVGKSVRSWVETYYHKDRRDHFLRILYSSTLTSLGGFEISLDPNRVTAIFEEAPIGVCQAIAEVLTPDRIYARDKKGRTAVDIACEKGLYWSALFLAKKGNPSLKPQRGRIVPYHLLEQEKASRKKEYSPLHVAVHFRRALDISALLEQRVDPEAQDSKGYTPLHLAAKLGDMKAIRALLAGKANMEAKTDFTKKTPLHLAAEYDHVEALRELLRAGANQEARDWLDNTPLHFAAKGKSARAVSLLITKEGIDLKNKSKETPLHLAAKSGCSEGISLLIQAKACLDPIDKYGRSPFLLAVRSGKKEAVSCFIDAGLDVNGGYILPEAHVRKDNKIEFRDCSESYLHEAARLGHGGIISLLIKAGADKDRRGLYGNTSLHMAAFVGQSNAIGILLERGADPTITSDHSKDTPLHIAALWSPLAAADNLLDAGANPNATNASGNAPLHFAFRHRNRGVAGVLCQRGGDVDLKNGKNDTFRSLVQKMESSKFKAEFSRWVS